MVVGIVLLAAGMVLVAGARPIGGALNDLRAEQIKRSSFLSGDQIERRRSLYQSPQNQTLESWIVRLVGLVIALGGIGSIVHALGR